jgi:eukaryotic-like serine/threonine-protein kinase
MEGVRNIRDSVIEAAALGLLATATLYLAPLSVAERLDRWFFDTWSVVTAPAAPDDILLIRVDDPRAIDPLVRAARGAHAKLLVTTQSELPAAQDDSFVLGPIETFDGESLPRATAWRAGGHLRFEPDMDGVVRHERPLLADGTLTPSLALRASEQLGLSDDRHAIASKTDGDGRRWLRFLSIETFPELTAAQALADPSKMRDKVLVVGSSGSAELTPLGVLSTHALLAEAIAGYSQGLSVDATWLGAMLSWGLAAVLIAGVGFLPPRERAIAIVAPLAAGIGMLGAGTVAFAAGLWLPITGPIAWLLIVGAVLAVRVPGSIVARPLEGDLAGARHAVASGDFAQAWSRYRQITPTSALLPELYSLACELDSTGQDRHAADLYHRIAQVNGQYRDVARRLVRCSQVGSAAVPLERDAMPHVMGRYQLLEPIGRGAMGYVYLGRDPKINRIVAIKAVDLAAEVEPTELDEARRNFLREAEIAGRLSHPNIVTIFDVGETDGVAYIAMEYLKGRHLSEFVRPDHLLPISTVLELLSKTADALDYAHSQNVVHRDIKPANIMYDSISDGLKITDFGIARLIGVGRTSKGIVLGTPAFMSPEQLEGKNVNGHTDLFALGVTLYQLLTGHLPFRGASMTKLMFVIANEPHESVTAARSDLPECLNSIVDRALAKDPSDRFQTGAEMATALRTAALAV